MNPPRRFTMHEMRVMHYRKQGGLCWLCAEPIDLFQPVHSWASASWEHMIPLGRGGSNSWKNVALTHWECNMARGDRFIWKLSRPRSRKDFQRPNKRIEQARFERQLVPRVIKTLQSLGAI